MQKIIHGLEDWWIEMQYGIKSIYFKTLGLPYYIYMEQNPSHWILISPEYADNMDYNLKYSIGMFDTLAYYGESFISSEKFDPDLDKFKIASYFENIDRTNTSLAYAIEEFYRIKNPEFKQVFITYLPDGVDWKIYQGDSGFGDGFREYVEQPHLTYMTDGTGVDIGYKKFTGGKCNGIVSDIDNS